MSKILKRIERKLGLPNLLEKFSTLSPTDLQSLLLEVYRQQAKKKDLLMF